MAIYSTFVEQSLEEQSMFRLITSINEETYITEGFIGDIFERLRKMLRKFKEWIVDRFRWIREKIRGIFGKKADTSNPGKNITIDTEYDLKFKYVYLDALGLEIYDMGKEFFYFNSASFFAYLTTTKGLESYEHYKEKLNTEFSKTRFRVGNYDLDKRMGEEVKNVERDVWIHGKDREDFNNELKDAMKKVEDASKANETNIKLLDKTVRETTDKVSGLENDLKRAEQTIRNSFESLSEDQTKTIIKLYSESIEQDIRNGKEAIEILSTAYSNLFNKMKINATILSKLETLHKKDDLTQQDIDSTFTGLKNGGAPER